MSKQFDPRSHVGETHGIYTIVGVHEERGEHGGHLYKVVCNECGYEKLSTYGHIASPSQTTTVCKHIGAHGGYVEQTDWCNARLGKIFRGMKSRCYNPNEKSYKWYGEKGIKVCDDWLNNPKSFEDWALSNGYTDDLTIDRVDDDKHYCPENCRWVTMEDNARYKSTTSLINVDGECHTGKSWAEILKLGTNVINTYVRKHGVENTIEFIRRFRHNPFLPRGNHNQSYYDLYMN